MIPASPLGQRRLVLLAAACLAVLTALVLLTGDGLAQAGKDKKDKTTKKEDKKEAPKKEEPKKEEPKDKTPPLLVLKGHTDWVNSVAYSRDGKLLVSASRDRTVRVWDASSGKELLILGDLPKTVEKTPPAKKEPAKKEKEEKKPAVPVHPTNVKDAVFSPDGLRVASSTGEWSKEKKEWLGEILLWDARSGKKTASLHGHSAEIESVAFSPDGKLLASGSEDATAILWDLATGQPKQTLKGHKSTVWSVAFNKDGTRLATASEDGSVKLWDVATGKDLGADKGGLKLAGLPMPAPPASKDAKKDKGPAKDKKGGKQGKGPKAPPPPEPIRAMTCVAFSPDGTKLAAGNLDGSLRIWDPATGKDLKTIKGPEGVWSISFSPDSQRLAAGGWNDMIRVWSVATGQQLLQRNGHDRTVTGVAFSPDGQRLATSGIDGLIKIWPAAK
jgi:predicted NACHT family NTPase